MSIPEDVPDATMAKNKEEFVLLTGKVLEETLTESESQGQKSQ